MNIVYRVDKGQELLIWKETIYYSNHAVKHG